MKRIFERLFFLCLISCSIIGCEDGGFSWDEYGGIVKGTVKDSKGNGLENARLSFRQDNDEVANDITNADGSYDILLDEGTYTVVFKYGAYSVTKPDIHVSEKRTNTIDDIILTIE